MCFNARETVVYLLFKQEIGCTQIALTNDCDGLNFFSGYQHNIWTVCRSASCIVMPKKKNIGVNERVKRERKRVRASSQSKCAVYPQKRMWILRWKKKPVPQLCSFAHAALFLVVSCAPQSFHSYEITCAAWWETVTVQRECIVIGLFCTSSIRMTTKRIERIYGKHVKNVQNNAKRAHECVGC